MLWLSTFPHDHFPPIQVGFHPPERVRLGNAETGDNRIVGLSAIK